MNVPKMSKAERTKAYTRFARKYGYFVRTVRTMTCLRYEAIKEWKEKKS
jgi:hypothetical protein